MDKGIGFSRKITLLWLDATATLCAETDDPLEIRERLEPILALDLQGKEARRKTIDVLLGVWHKSREVAPALRAEALEHFQSTASPTDRLWLHYGLVLVYYPFFRDVAAIIGQLGRRGELVGSTLVTERMFAMRGEIGALHRSVRYILSTLRSWELLTGTETRNAYEPAMQRSPASSIEIEKWLLAGALTAHPAEELPFADLARLPELYPFRFTVGIDHLRRDARFAIQRQGEGWDAVRVTMR